nr:adenylate kinase isoenzyme 5-like [Onthophagus taurus]
MGNIFACIDDLTKSDARGTYDMSLVRSKKLPIIWLLGPPGSGRSTQANILSEKLGYELINVAELIKKEALLETERAYIIKDVLDSKNRKVQDDLVVDLIKEEMLKNVNEATGFIINGFPRTAKQAALFVKEIKDVDVVIYLYLETMKMVNRLREKEGSIDEDAVKNDIFTYVKEVKDGTAKFATKVEKIYTDGLPSDVFQKIESIIQLRMKPTQTIM